MNASEFFAKWNTEQLFSNSSSSFMQEWTFIPCSIWFELTPFGTWWVNGIWWDSEGDDYRNTKKLGDNISYEVLDQCFEFCMWLSLQEDVEYHVIDLLDFIRWYVVEGAYLS